MMSFVSSYHPFVSSTLNYVQHRYEILLELQHYCLNSLIFYLHYTEEQLALKSEEEMVKEWLKPFHASLCYPSFSTMEEAIDFAHWHIQEQGPLPVQVNQAMHPVNPYPFDFDDRQYWLLLEQVDDRQYLFYDQTRDKIFEISLGALMKAIDTPRNYDDMQHIRPFLTVEMNDEQGLSESEQRPSKEYLLDQWVEKYPLENNLNAVERFSDRLWQRKGEVHTLRERHEILYSFQTIRKSREFMDQCMCELGFQNHQQERFPLWPINESRLSAYLFSYSSELLDALQEGLRRAVLVECRWYEHMRERYPKQNRMKAYV